MINNYLKTSFRSLKHNKLFVLINLSGLSLGLACYILVLLYTKDELTYDRFHENIEQIYQLTCERIEQNGAKEKFAIAAMVQGPAFKREVPEIKQFTRVNPKNVVVKVRGNTFDEKVTWVDEHFFNIFSFPLLSGQSEQVLSEPGKIVLTEKTAQKYFNSVNAIGETILVEVNGKFEHFTVSGVSKDAPENSSIKFNVLLPFSYLEQNYPDNGWGWVSYPTYFLIHASANVKAVTNKMKTVYQVQAKDEMDLNHLAGYDNKFVWGLLPFEKMHLDTEYAGVPEASNPVYTYILTAIGLFVLTIACINFINLSIAQSLKKGKEIGIRKVNGAMRMQLIRQFLSETFVICFAAFLLGLLLAELALPYFNKLANKRLGLGYLLDTQLFASFLLLFLITGFAAGFYPAFVLSGLNPVFTLYKRTLINGKNLLWRSLVTLQFVLATVLVICTFVIFEQFSYLTKADLGYQDKNLIEFDFPSAVMNKSLMDVIKAKLSRLQVVENVAYRNIGHFGGKTQAGQREFSATYIRVDHHFLPAMGVRFAGGRNFSEDLPSDSVSSVIVNETLVKLAGWKDPVGKTIDFMNLPGWGDRQVNIIGVVQDFHDESLRETIKPQIFTMDTRLPLGHFLIRIHHGNIAETTKMISDVYQQFMPDHPFAFSFRDELNKKSYQKELMWKQVITMSTALTILISCIGLFGLAVLSAEKQRKEIGIRKVLGASISQMVILVSKDFVVLVAVSFLIAAPFAWYMMSQWLNNFAYRVTLSWWQFGLAGVLTLLVTLLTISFEAIKASLADPVKVLRNE